MTLKVVWTNEFKKDYKLMLKRHKDISKLDNIIEKLANEKPLPNIKTTILSADLLPFESVILNLIGC